MIVSQESLKKFLILHGVYVLVLVATEFCFLHTFTAVSPFSDFLALLGFISMLLFNFFFLIFLAKKLDKAKSKT